MIILRNKTFSNIPKSPNADKAYEKWKTSKDPKDAKAFIKLMEKKEKDKRRFDDWLEKE